MTATTPVIAALALALAGCTVEREVLGEDNSPLTTCEQVWLRGAPGDACDLPQQCTRPDPVDPMCCVGYAYCRSGSLVMDMTCNPDCSSCVDDHSCTPGAATCNGMTCSPCPPIDPTGQMCPPCPTGWSLMTRNGCETCECAPPSECAVGTQPCDAMDPNGGQCYPGARFADPNCAPDDPGCFANVCSAPGCPGPAPLGCFTACDPTLPNCQQCATTSCECDPSTGGWSCQSICIDQTPVSLTCFL